MPDRADASATSSFEIRTPPGWVDLSKGDPREGALPPEAASTVAAIRANADSVYVAMLPGEDVTITGFLRPASRTEPIDEAALSRIRHDMHSVDFFDVGQMAVENIGGLGWGRLEGTTSEAQRFVTFAVPGNPRNLLLTYSGRSPAFERHLAEFESAARATGGASLPPKNDTDPIHPLLVGIPIFLVVFFAHKAYVRLKKRGA